MIEGRYAPGKKPLSWDERSAGVDKVRTTEGEELTLFSGGGQSTPAPGWELLLTGERNGDAPAYSWTLYGISRST